jgi:hypothetical protein
VVSNWVAAWELSPVKVGEELETIGEDAEGGACSRLNQKKQAAAKTTVNKTRITVTATDPFELSLEQLKN